MSTETSSQLDEIGEGIKKTEIDLSKFSLPKRPASFGEEYDFPDKIDGVSYQELGQWLFKLAAWRGYALRMLALKETKFSVLDNVADAAVAKRIAQGDKDGKKLTKDLAMGLRLQETEFRKLKSQLIDAESEVIGLKRIAEIYTMQMEAVSREISRRVSEMKNLPG